MMQGNLKRTMSLKRYCALAALVLAGYASTALAVDIPIDNSGFELPDAAGTYVVQVPDGWTASAGLDDVFVEDTASVNMSGGDGLQYAGMDSNVGAGSYIYQDLGIPFQAGMAYQVDLAGAHRAGTTHGTVEFGVFSSDAIGVDLGTPGFIDLQGVWAGSGNPDADDMFDVFRDASALNAIGSGALGNTSYYFAGSSVPSGNVVVYVRDAQQSARINFDNIRLDESPGFNPADVDENGDVSLTDYETINNNFLLSPATRAEGDITGANIVDLEDFILWRTNYPYPSAAAAASGSTQVVPEPATWLLGAFGAAMMAATRRFVQ